MARILVIEDEAPIRQNLVFLLRAEGHEVESAPNGRAGLEMVDKFHPALVLCDVMMPELDGFGVLEALRGKPATASLPFIFLTARADRADLRKGMSGGADDYLTKPFTRQEVLEAVSARISRMETVAAGVQTGSLEQAFEAFSGSDGPFGILCVKFDRFTEVIAGLDSIAVSNLLAGMRERLERYCDRKGSVHQVLGETFVVLVREAPENDTALFAEELVRLLREPVLVGARRIYLTASIGLARFPHQGETLDALLGCARAAMTRARNAGGDTVRDFPDTGDLAPDKRLEMESALHNAAANCELIMNYQPQVQLATGRLTGFEALVRWRHPQLGLVSPAVFIELAEENGAIGDIGAWVLKAACSQLQEWLASGLPPVAMGVNVSARQLRDPGFLAAVEAALTSTGIPPRLLDLEVTESALVRDTKDCAQLLAQVRALGVHLSIDDFGTGYSGLEYLRQLPFDRLKIDRCFVTGLPESEGNAAIVRSIVDMSHGLRMSAIAEGVETQAEVDYLRSIHCDEVQGYYFSRPLSAEQCPDVISGATVLGPKTA